MRRESRLKDQIVRALRARGAWVIRVHGAGWARRGVPDIVGIFRRQGFGLEVKVPGGKANWAQSEELRKIGSAGGVAGIVHSVEEAIDLLGDVAPWDT